MKNVLLFSLGLFVALNSTAQTTIYTQDFEVSPVDWISASDNSGPGFIHGTSSSRSSANFQIPTPAIGSGIIAVNDEQCACQSDDAIFSQNFNLTGYDSVRISFKSYVKKVNNEEAYLLVNKLGTHGVWSNYDGYNLPTSTTGWNNLYITIPAAELSANFHIGFYFNDRNLASRGMAIDDLKIIGYNTPANNICSTATPLTPSASCSPISGSIMGASGSGLPAACTPGATPSTDVWYSFQATTESVSILAQSTIATQSNGFDLVVELYEGTCTGLSLLGCSDEDDITETGATGLESINIGDLTIGNTYYLRVYNYFGAQADNGSFLVCVENIPSCDLTQPLGSITENETCGQTVNTSCATGMNISCGDVIWGSYSANTGTRDLDYYKFTITDPTTVNITLKTEFPGALVLYDAANCTSLTALAGQYVDACSSTTITQNITTAGTYAILVMPNSFYSPSCTGTKNNYILSYSANTMTPVASATGMTSVCSGNSVPLNATGTGSFQWYNGTTLISGATTATYSATTSGSYTAVLNNANGCAATSNAINVTINPTENAAFTYPAGTLCANSPNISATITGDTGGTFTSSNGLVFVDNSTGEIDVTASSLGNYTITYTTAGTCFTSATASLTITDLPNAAFSYPISTFCASDPNPLPIMAGSIGVFSSSSGLSINSTTGEINVASSTPGEYTVTNSIAAANGCPAVSEIYLLDIFVTPEPVASASNMTLTVTADANNAIQWFNCADDQPIDGERSATFIATNPGSYYATVRNDNHCTGRTTCVSVTNVSVNTISMKNIEIFPNPSTSVINISGLTGKASVSILDVHGKIVFSTKVDTSHSELNVSSLESGVYFINISSQEINGTQRFIKR